MNRTKALLLGASTTGTISAWIGGIGVSGLGGAIGVGFLPAVAIGGLIGVGIYEIYGTGERREREFHDLLREYDRRNLIRE